MTDKSIANTGEPELSIIIPCLDEEDNVVITLAQVLEVLQNSKISDFEILVCDDASTDETFAHSEDFREKHPQANIRTMRRKEPRRGYGAVVRHGVANARGLYCVPVSGDGVDPVELIPEMVKKMRGGADLIQCSRYHDRAHQQTIGINYKVLQSCWRFLVGITTGQRFPDSTYAFKMFRRVDVLSLGITANGFSIGPEVFFKVFLNDGRIDYVKSGQGVRRHGKSKFYFRRELFGFSYVLARVFLHRIGVLWF